MQEFEKMVAHQYRVARSLLGAARISGDKPTEARLGNLLQTKPHAYDGNLHYVLYKYSLSPVVL